MVVGSLDGSKVSSSKEVEARVILVALSEAKMRGFPKAHLISDALEVVRAINGTRTGLLTPILQDISSLATSFELFEVSHIPRVLNPIAYSCVEKT